MMSNIDCKITASANGNKIMKNVTTENNCNSSRFPWEEAEASKRAAAHSLGTTVVL